MKNKFPYPGITKKVTEEMCDLNGHMNVTFYTKIFEIMLLMNFIF